MSFWRDATIAVWCEKQISWQQLTKYLGVLRKDIAYQVLKDLKLHYASCTPHVRCEVSWLSYGTQLHPAKPLCKTRDRHCRSSIYKLSESRGLPPYHMPRWNTSFDIQTVFPVLPSFALPITMQMIGGVVLKDAPTLVPPPPLLNSKHGKGALGTRTTYSRTTGRIWHWKNADVRLIDSSWRGTLPGRETNPYRTPARSDMALPLLYPANLGLPFLQPQLGCSTNFRLGRMAVSTESSFKKYQLLIGGRWLSRDARLAGFRGAYREHKW
jgi:hypothetical protein